MDSTEIVGRPIGSKNTAQPLSLHSLATLFVLGASKTNAGFPAIAKSLRPPSHDYLRFSVLNGYEHIVIGASSHAWPLSWLPTTLDCISFAYSTVHLVH